MASITAAIKWNKKQKRRVCFLTFSRSSGVCLLLVHPRCRRSNTVDGEIKHSQEMDEGKKKAWGRQNHTPGPICLSVCLSVRLSRLLSISPTVLSVGTAVICIFFIVPRIKICIRFFFLTKVIILDKCHKHQNYIGWYNWQFKSEKPRATHSTHSIWKKQHLGLALQAGTQCVVFWLACMDATEGKNLSECVRLCQCWAPAAPDSLRQNENGERTGGFPFFLTQTTNIKCKKTTPSFISMLHTQPKKVSI